MLPLLSLALYVLIGVFLGVLVTLWRADKKQDDAHTCALVITCLWPMLALVLLVFGGMWLLGQIPLEIANWVKDYKRAEPVDLGYSRSGKVELDGTFQVHA